jgi:hypothetical protein
VRVERTFVRLSRFDRSSLVRLLDCCRSMHSKLIRTRVFIALQPVDRCDHEVRSVALHTSESHPSATWGGRAPQRRSDGFERTTRRFFGRSTWIRVRSNRTLISINSVNILVCGVRTSACCTRCATHRRSVPCERAVSTSAGRACVRLHSGIRSTAREEDNREESHEEKKCECMDAHAQRSMCTSVPPVPLVSAAPLRPPAPRLLYDDHAPSSSPLE